MRRFSSNDIPLPAQRHRTTARASRLVLSTACVLVALFVTVSGGQAQQRVLARTPSHSVELESLAGSAAVSAGAIVVQEMAAFGPGWGNNAQLFWRPPAPTDQPIRNYPYLSMLFEVPASGDYELTLQHTLAPDYGRFTVLVAGRKAADLDGYDAAVRVARKSLGRHKLEAGANQITFTVFGKAAASTGYIVGLDRLDAVPVVQAVAQPRAQARTQSPPPAAALSNSALQGRGKPILVHAHYALPLAGKGELFRRDGDVYSPVDIALDPDDVSLSAPYQYSVLQSPKATGVLWQVSHRPFSPTLPITGDPLNPEGLLQSGTVWKKSWTFEVDVAAIAADLGWRKGPERVLRSDAPLTARKPAGAAPIESSAQVRDGSALRKNAAGFADARLKTVGPLREIDDPFSHYFASGGTAMLYLRVLPVAGGEASPRVVGYPSPTATITYGERPPMANPFQGLEWRQRDIPRLAISSFSYRPGYTDTRWPKGCIADKGGNDYWNPFEFLEDAWDWASGAFADIKSSFVDFAGQLLPFVPRSLLEGALDAALIAAGVPPGLPNIGDLMEEGAAYLAEEAASTLLGPVGSAVTKQIGSELLGDAVANLSAEALQEVVQDELERRLANEIESRAAAARAAVEASAAETMCQSREYPPIVKMTVRNLEHRRFSDVAITVQDEAELYLSKTLTITLDPNQDYKLVLPLGPDLFTADGRRKERNQTAMDAWWDDYQDRPTRFVVSGATISTCLEDSYGHVSTCNELAQDDSRRLHFETPSLFGHQPIAVSGAGS